MAGAWPDPATNGRWFPVRYLYHDLAPDSLADFTNGLPWTVVLLGWSMTTGATALAFAGALAVKSGVSATVVVDSFGITEVPLGTSYHNGELFIGVGPGEVTVVENFLVSAASVDVAVWGVACPVVVATEGP